MIKLVAAALAVLSSSPVGLGRTDGQLPAGILEHATLEARTFAGEGAQIQQAEGRPMPGCNYIVCGSVAVNGESLPLLNALRRR
jgi:hypothetical protein